MTDFTTKTGSTFASIYPQINEMILAHGEPTASRYGDTVESLGFKTVISDPVSRCVGGQKRDINVFFLLAEALWIWAGHSDVAFLKIFNTRMEEFSDDGETFHAPYGFRLRQYDTPSSVVPLPFNEDNDQIARAIELLKDKETRRCVLSIWNPKFDLFSKKPTKDIPCNDLLMFKVRNNALRLTIANRSNDLHWGLPTNVFQFSFILEVMSHLVGVNVGAQQHNSDSLHIYTDNPVNKIHENMSKEFSQGNVVNVYDLVKASKMDFNFSMSDEGSTSLEYVDNMFNDLIDMLSLKAEIKANLNRPDGHSFTQSKYFTLVYEILSTYVDYTKTTRNDNHKLKAIFRLCEYQSRVPYMCNDYFMLALNWFHSRLKSEDAVQASLSEIKMLNVIPELHNVDYSYVGRL